MPFHEHTCHTCGKECSHTHPKDFIAGAILGGIIGTAAGLLLAPKSGAELRQELTDKVQEITENTHDFASSIQSKGHKMAKNATSTATSWVDQARDVVETLSDEIHEWKDRNKNGTTHIKETLESTTHKVDEVLDWAALGIRLWQTAKRRR